jgi:hypothetical protein
MLGLSPVTFSKSDITTAVTTALAAPGTVLICWQHEDIPTIATTIASLSQLSVTPTPPSTWPPPTWPGSRYDLVWMFDLVQPVQANQPYTWKFAQVPQLLLPGDSPTPIQGSGN